MRRLRILSIAILSLLPGYAHAQTAPAPTTTPAVARVDAAFFNGKDLANWSGPAMAYWSVEEGAIVGKSDKPIPRNEFIWSPVEVADFYLSLDVRLDPDGGNAGVQFRSRKLPPNEAVGYQADMGAGVWGRLYHESGRQKLDWRDRGEKAVKRGEWNRYEILAVGDRIWTTINGKLAVSVRDPKGERTGFIALQVHAGAPLTARYRVNQLVHNPKVELAGLSEQQLDAELIAPGEAKPAGPRTRPATPPATQRADVNRPAQRFGDVPGARPVAPAPFADGKFDVADEELIVFAGQTNMLRAAHSGDLEARLAIRHADRRPRFRCMAVEGDTVYQQWRDLDFGPWPEQLAWAGATAVIAQFGQTESLDGVAKLDAFREDYGKLLDAWMSVTPRIVLVGPMPFERPPAGSLLPDQSTRNADVRAYAEAIRSLAKSRGLVYVDLLTPLAERSGGQPLTGNGLHLTPAGQRAVAEVIAAQLGAATPADPARLDAVRAAVIEKNRLWTDNWRPMNWAFAYGDRSQQPFSKPGGGRPALRVELEAFKPLIAEADAQVHREATARR